MKKIVFITGTRADFGKQKQIIKKSSKLKNLEVKIFCTGMHMLKKYGETHMEVDLLKNIEIFKFINQNDSDQMDHILAKTVSGLSDYISEMKPDFIVIHGDRVEALAGAIVGSLNNIKTIHIEGGEVSGTIDESIRHAVSKLSHIHLTSTTEASERLKNMGENPNSVFTIGSPDIDIMNSKELPSLTEVKNYYNINFKNYGILIYHPVTTDTKNIEKYTNILIKTLIKSKKNYVVIFPNNDPGNKIIIKKYNEILKNNRKFIVFPSMRFEYFLTLLKNSSLIIGNSSVGIRESAHYGVGSIDIGSRQNSRQRCSSVINVKYNSKKIITFINEMYSKKFKPNKLYGDGMSSAKFLELVKNNKFDKVKIQKVFFNK